MIPDPDSRHQDLKWQHFVERHGVGDVIDGVVVDVVVFGSFVEYRGLHGLAFQLEWPVGTQVSVRILAIDSERRRFSLEAA
ncbi:hypothetical protein [Antrihabitans spumae]|uniref:S1 motif domain-containing protein n=1 Tax=Antrihabitans spumae TaxID=3373370 RepID=A0ABW7JWM5_9NOCA